MTLVVKHGFTSSIIDDAAAAAAGEAVAEQPNLDAAERQESLRHELRLRDIEWDTRYLRALNLAMEQRLAQYHAQREDEELIHILSTIL